MADFLEKREIVHIEEEVIVNTVIIQEYPSIIPLHSVLKFLFSITAATGVAILYYDGTQKHYLDNSTLQFIETFCGVYVNFFQTAYFMHSVTEYFFDILHNQIMERQAKIGFIFTIFFLSCLGDIPNGSAEYFSSHSILKTMFVLYGNFPQNAFAIANQIVAAILNQVKNIYNYLFNSTCENQSKNEIASIKKIMADFYKSGEKSIWKEGILVPFNLSRTKILSKILDQEKTKKIPLLFDHDNINDYFYLLLLLSTIIGSIGGIWSNLSFTCSNILVFKNIKFLHLNNSSACFLGILDMIPLYVIGLGVGQVFKALCMTLFKVDIFYKFSFLENLSLIAFSIPGILSHGTVLALLISSCPSNYFFQNTLSIWSLIICNNIANIYWTYKAAENFLNDYKARYAEISIRKIIHSCRNFEQFCNLTTVDISQLKIEAQLLEYSNEWCQFLSNLNDQHIKLVIKYLHLPLSLEKLNAKQTQKKKHFSINEIFYCFFNPKQRTHDTTVSNKTNYQTFTQ